MTNDSTADRPMHVRRLASWLPPLGLAAFAYVYTVPLAKRWGVPALADEAMGIAVAATLALPFGILAGSKYARAYPALRPLNPAVLAIGCSASVVAAGALIGASDEPAPVGNAVTWTAGALALSWLAVFQYARGSESTFLERVLTADDPEQGAELVERCRATLRDSALDPVQRAVVSLSLAGALVALSARADQDDALTEALAILGEVAATNSPALAFEAALMRADAMLVKAKRSGDEVGYDEALDHLTAAADRAVTFVPVAPGKALAARAARFVQRASREPRHDEAARLRDRAITELKSALAVTPDDTYSHALHSVELARLEGAHPLRGDLDGAIKRCRAALRRLRSADSGDRATARLALIELLELRAVLEPGGGLGGALDRLWPNRPRHGFIAWLWPERAENDLARALFLQMRVALSPGRGSDARARLPDIRNRLSASVIPGLPGLDRQADWMYAHVYAEQVRISRTAAAEAAARWAAWAESRGKKKQAGEAWWCWVKAIAGDMRGRVLEDKEHRIARMQGLVVEAAYRLVEAERPRDAALALDLGRAMLITERMERDRAGLEERLVAAGRAELAARWRDANEGMRRIDREAFERGDGDVPSESRLASAEYLALLEHERVLREVSHLPRFEDVDAAPDYDDLRAAARDGPVVYLATRDEGGFALVVTEAAEPVHVALPGLERAVVDEHVDSLIPLEEAHELAPVMEPILESLWSSVVRPLSAHLPRGSLVTLIPLGRLGQLPIHMAGAVRDGSGTWCDGTGGTVFRYAPNARVLLRAQDTARRFAGADLSVLTVAVPKAHDLSLLPSAVTESDGVAARFGPSRTTRLPRATTTQVLRHLDDCEVWHFACHGEHDPAAPLDSTLQLADGPLALRTMFARPSAARRLAVLSACQTAMVDPALLDEVVGFPAAMMQSGVAGAVAAQAVVDDEEAMLLVLDFFARFSRSGEPARALADAQAWVRTATKAEIDAAYPGLVSRRSDDDKRPFEEPASWVLFSYTGA